MPAPLPSPIRDALLLGAVIPAMPLALTAARSLDERRQRALIRYYADAGAGGLAVGVHTTQFAIRAPEHGLFRPVLELAKEELDRADARLGRSMIRIGGICGPTAQAVAEAEALRDLGYHAGLLSLAALSGSDDDAMLAHCRAVGEVLPLVGFYLQRAVGGPELSFRFWRRFTELDAVAAIKVAPFDRYRTLDVVRAVAESGRTDIALYTGNDDNIILDLLTPYRVRSGDGWAEVRFAGGLLGHWAVWTRRAVEHLEACRACSAREAGAPAELLRLSAQVTDANAALFDVANGFAGCIAGLHEVLRRQGLLEGIWCLDPEEGLGPGQLDEIDRVARAYPDLNDDAFVAEHLDRWLSG
ncbi:dihydrodipicolinate synthase family protein [Tautonia sociabilis]|uniref:Dihydrodipicolinate synthase family protein n=1 Tax=Tautonia sociabilis TaxID=2080755 RepID=A0A432MGA3_9BACT|nr:dihydrodipicolinate synthase family protein [Tautonia sociabilis]RUL85624.1 dihydrodipicolinate synthase family protein [Tautonia sociabilis]